MRIKTSKNYEWVAPQEKLLIRTTNNTPKTMGWVRFIKVKKKIEL